MTPLSVLTSHLRGLPGPPSDYAKREPGRLSGQPEPTVASVSGPIGTVRLSSVGKSAAVMSPLKVGTSSVRRESVPAGIYEVGHQGQVVGALGGSGTTRGAPPANQIPDQLAGAA